MLMMRINLVKQSRKITSAVRVEPKMTYNTYLLVQCVGAGHWVQLTGLDKFLTHQTQLTSGCSLWDKKAGHN